MTNEEEILATLKKILETQEQALALQKQAIENQQKAITQQEMSVRYQHSTWKIYRISLLILGAALAAGLLFLWNAWRH